MKSITPLQRIWLQVTAWPIALCIAAGDLAITALVNMPGTPGFDPAVFVVLTIPVDGALGWLVLAGWLAALRRARLRKSLHAVLDKHGEVALQTHMFPDIPFCTGQKMVFCARGSEIHVEALDEIVWVYAESFRGLFSRHQLVLWNRHAVASVLPIRKAHIAPALEQLRQAASWLPVGYSDAMKESWNADHRDLIALIDSHRHALRPFDPPWGGKEVARVTAGTSSSFAKFQRSRDKSRLEKQSRGWEKT